MSITVRELLQLPHLRLTLTADQAGLGRQVSWVHSSDLPDPWEWLGPAELLLTNGTSLSAEEEAQVLFIERLGETGASGLCIGLGMPGPPLSAGAARRADELALPLLGVPYSVPFTAVCGIPESASTTSCRPSMSGNGASVSTRSGFSARAISRALSRLAVWRTRWPCRPSRSTSGRRLSLPLSTMSMVAMACWTVAAGCFVPVNDLASDARRLSVKNTLSTLPGDVPPDGVPRELRERGFQPGARALAERLSSGEILFVGFDAKVLSGLRGIILSSIVWSGSCRRAPDPSS